MPRWGERMDQLEGTMSTIEAAPDEWRGIWYRRTLGDGIYVRWGAGKSDELWGKWSTDFGCWVCTGDQKPALDELRLLTDDEAITMASTVEEGYRRHMEQQATSNWLSVYNQARVGDWYEEEQVGDSTRVRIGHDDQTLWEQFYNRSRPNPAASALGGVIAGQMTTTPPPTRTPGQGMTRGYWRGAVGRWTGCRRGSR